MTFEVHQEKEDDFFQVFRVEVPEDWIKGEEQRVSSALGKVVRVNGFRKGKVPGKMVQRMFPERVMGMIAGSIIEKVKKEELKEMDCLVVGEGQPIDYSREKGKGLTLRFAAPSIKREDLPDYKEWTLERYIYPISEGNVEQTIQRIQEEHVSLEEKAEGAVEPGDVCLVDLQLMQGSTAVVGYKSEEPVALEMGRDSLGRGTDEQLLGAAKGDVRRVTVVPEAPTNEGGSRPQRREYEATVRQVYSRALPELNETFYTQVSQGRAKDEEAFKGFVKDYLEREAQGRQRRELQTQIRDQLHEKSPWTPPQDMVQRQVEHMKSSMRGEGTEEAGPEQEEQVRTVALKQVKVHFLMEALAADMEISVEKEEVDRALQASNISQEDRDSEETRNAVEAAMLNDRIYSRILSETQIKDVPMKSMESVLA